MPESWDKRRAKLIDKAKIVPESMARMLQDMRSAGTPPGEEGVPRLGVPMGPGTRSGTGTNVRAPPPGFEYEPDDVGIDPRTIIPISKPSAIVCSDGTTIRLAGRPPSAEARMTLRQLQERNEATAALAFEAAMKTLLKLLRCQDKKVVLGAASKLADMGRGNGRGKAPATTRADFETVDSERGLPKQESEEIQALERLADSDT